MDWEFSIRMYLLVCLGIAVIGLGTFLGSMGYGIWVACLTFHRNWKKEQAEAGDAKPPA